MFPPKPFANNIFENAKYHTPYDDEICDPSLSGLVFGFDREQCNKTLMEWSSTSTSSVRAIVHYGQEINSGASLPWYGFFLYLNNMMSIIKAIHVDVFSQVVSVSTTLVKQKTLRYMGKHIRRLMRLTTYRFLLRHIGAIMIGSLNRRWVMEDTDHDSSKIQNL